MDSQNAFQGLIKSFARLTFFFFVGACLLCSTASAEVAVSTAVDGQFLPWVVDDGEGGVIVMWEDYRTGKDWDVYAQRVDSAEKARWELNGLAICTADRNQRRLRMIRYDNHAIVVWNDRRDRSNWDIYAQAVSLDGNVLWQTDGIPVCVDTADQSTQAIMSDGEGGAICVWEDERRSSEFQDLYIQRISATGEPIWKVDGIPVFPSESLQSNPIPIRDATGGFYIVWWDVIGYETWHLKAYRLRLDAEPLWEAPIFVTPTRGMQGEPRVIADGEGGIIVLWQVYENFINDQLYAQRITADGSKMWDEDGVAVCTAVGIQKHASVVSDGSGGFIAVWRDERDVYSDLYAQRVRADGTLAWAKDGIPICTAGGHQDKPFIVETEKDRFFVAWVDYREDFGEESRDAIYGQQIDLSGTLLWEETGVPISTSKGEHHPPFVTSTGNGKWVVVWSNMQEDKGDIYLERF